MRKEDITNLSEVDTYSLILFALYKLKDIPEYSAISELAYVLDKDNLLKLCEYFGGLTIRIPTIEDLEMIIYTLVLYQYIDIEGMSYDKAITLIGKKVLNSTQIKKSYNKLKQILDKYEFGKE